MSEKKKKTTQDPDPFLNPAPGGSKSKRPASSQQPAFEDLSGSSGSEEDAAKTPKKVRRATIAPARNKALWENFEMDPSVPKGKHGKNTKVRKDVVSAHH